MHAAGVHPAPGPKNDTCDLCRCLLCTGNTAWSDARQVFHYRKGQVLFEEGGTVPGLYFVSSGAVKVHQSWGAGNEFILRFAVSGDVLGHRAQAAIAASPVSVPTLGHRAQAAIAGSPVSATALDRTSACFISNELLQTTLATTPSLMHMMMLLYASELVKAEKRMRDLALMPVKSRVAEALLAIRQTIGPDDEGFFRIPVTRLDIACYAGTTYETVFRLLTGWRKDGLISTAGKRIKINDEKKLNALILKPA